MAGTAATAETLRIATFAAPLSRDGPGLLLRDIEKGEDAQILAVRDIIAKVSPPAGLSHCLLLRIRRRFSMVPKIETACAIAMSCGSGN